MVWNLTKPEVIEEYDFYLTEDWSNGINSIYWAKQGTKFKIDIDEAYVEFGFNLKAISGEYNLVAGFRQGPNLMNIAAFKTFALLPVSKRAQKIITSPTRKWRFSDE